MGDAVRLPVRAFAFIALHLVRSAMKAGLAEEEAVVEVGRTEPGRG